MCYETRHLVFSSDKSLLTRNPVRRYSLDRRKVRPLHGGKDADAGAVCPKNPGVHCVADLPGR